MYPRKAVNVGVLIASMIVLVASLWVVRSQATVDDVSYMHTMIPHHSIAFLTLDALFICVVAMSFLFVLVKP